MKSQQLLIAVLLLAGFSSIVSAHGGHNEAFAEKSGKVNHNKKIKLSPEGKEAIGIKTEAVKKSFLNKYIDVTGQVSVAGDKHYDVSLAVSGLVKQVLVQEGDKITKGQLLAVIQSLEATQALQSLLRRKTNIEKEIQVLSNELEVKKAAYLREKTLVEEGISPKKDLLEANSVYESAKASLAASKKDASVIISSSKSELDIMGLPLSIVDKALSSGLIDPNISIRSPIDGVLSVRNINPGEAIERSQEIFSVDNLKPIWVNVDIYQDQIPYVKLGQTVKITSSSAEELEGKIANIASSIKLDTRTLAVRIVSKNEKETLKPGMMVNAKIVFDKSDKKSIVIPSNALITKSERSIVYLEHGDYYQSVEIKIGFQDSWELEVIDGLTEGDLIVVQGAEQIYSESLLKGSSHGHHHGHGHNHSKKSAEFPWTILIAVLLSSGLTSLVWFLKVRSAK